MWSLNDGSCVEVLRGHRDEVLRVAWAPGHVERVAGAAMVATAGADGRAILWRLSESVRAVCDLHGGDQIYGCEWLGEWLATACEKRLEVWDVASGRKVSRREYTGLVFDAQSNPGADFGSLIACALSDGSIVVHDYRDPSLAATLQPADERRATAVSWDPCGKKLAACYGSGAVRLFDVATWRSRAKRADHNKPVYGAAWQDTDSVLTWAADHLATWRIDEEARFFDPGFDAFHAAICHQHVLDKQLLAVVGGADYVDSPSVVIFDMSLFQHGDDTP